MTDRPTPPAISTDATLQRRVQELVTSDPDIMGGDPVFCGTRVPVHAIAAQFAQGDSAADVLKGYPRLTLEMVEFAPVYAAAYPLCGEPRTQPWHDRPPISVTRRKLATNEAGLKDDEVVVTTYALPEQS